MESSSFECILLAFNQSHIEVASQMSYSARQRRARFDLRLLLVFSRAESCPVSS
jgi:hypothetical protein